MAQALRLDTLKLARKLTDAGLDARVAEALTEGLSDADTQDLASKSDLANLATKADLSEFKADMFRQLWIMGAGIVGVTVALLKFLP